VNLDINLLTLVYDSSVLVELSIYVLIAVVLVMVAHTVIMTGLNHGKTVSNTFKKRWVKACIYAVGFIECCVLFNAAMLQLWFHGVTFSFSIDTASFNYYADRLFNYALLFGALNTMAYCIYEGNRKQRGLPVSNTVYQVFRAIAFSVLYLLAVIGVLNATSYLAQEALKWRF